MLPRLWSVGLVLGKVLALNSAAGFTNGRSVTGCSYECGCLQVPARELAGPLDVSSWPGRTGLGR
jgi:hypothetical protein